MVKFGRLSGAAALIRSQENPLIVDFEAVVTDDACGNITATIWISREPTLLRCKWQRVDAPPGERADEMLLPWRLTIPVSAKYNDAQEYLVKLVEQDLCASFLGCSQAIVTKRWHFSSSESNKIPSLPVAVWCLFMRLVSNTKAAIQTISQRSV